jgi:hypothetical protein
MESVRIMGYPLKLRNLSGHVQYTTLPSSIVTEFYGNMSIEGKYSGDEKWDGETLIQRLINMPVMSSLFSAR